MLLHLAQHNFPCSRPLPGRDGSYLMQVQLPSSSNNNTTHIARALSFMPGRVLATVRTPTPAMRHALGRCIAQLTAVLVAERFDHPGAHRGMTFDWDIRAAPRVVRQYVAYSEDARCVGSHLCVAQTSMCCPPSSSMVCSFHPSHSALLQAVDVFEQHTKYLSNVLPTSILHGDANEHNILVSDTPPHDVIVGLLDVGDCHYGWRVAEIGIAAVYQAGMAVACAPWPMDDEEILCIGMHAATDVVV